MFGKAQKKQILRNSLLLKNISTKFQRGTGTHTRTHTQTDHRPIHYWPILYVIYVMIKLSSHLTFNTLNQAPKFKSLKLICI